MKKIKGKYGALVFTTMAMMLFLSISPPLVSAEGEHDGEAPDELIIEDVMMSDENLICAAMGGQEVDIVVWVKNTADYLFTEEFDVDLYIDAVTYLTSGGYYNNIQAGDTVPVYIPDVQISLPVNWYDLDAYINNDPDVTDDEDFCVTLFGLS
jgi:hypothetical protein